MKAARRARDMRLVDEKFAKYGPLKDLVKGNPTGEAFIFKLEKAWGSNIVWYVYKRKDVVMSPLLIISYFI